FQREMRVIGQLSHPAIVQATDAGEVDGTHFLVMEYVEGCDLNSLAKACGPLSVADACEIARQAALGLEYAHQQGIVHRDIKPSNLMLSRESRVQSREQDSLVTDSQLSIKILDLGLALLSGEQAPVDELTTVGQLMGTLDYMAPEQLEDSHLVGPRADIYALAATLYRLLTGVAPFAKDDRKTPLQKLRALATQAAPPIRERRADVPEELAAIIDRALSRDPAARFLSMSEFAAALTPWCAGHDLSQLAGHVSNVPGPALELHPLSSHVRQNVDERTWLQDEGRPEHSERAR
ncbi:MAG: pkn2, partial [Planctomycetota bacterium]